MVCVPKAGWQTGQVCCGGPGIRGGGGGEETSPDKLPEAETLRLCDELAVGRPGRGGIKDAVLQE